LLSILKELYYILAQKKPKYLYFSIFYPKGQLSLKMIYFFKLIKGDTIYGGVRFKNKKKLWRTLLKK